MYSEKSRLIGDANPEGMEGEVHFKVYRYCSSGGKVVISAEI